MRNIIFKSKILKDILGQDNITKLEDLDKLFHESEAFEGLYESTVDLKDIEFSEQDMKDLIDDINLLNNLDKDNIRCMRLVNFPEELKQRKIIYSVLNPTLVEIEDEEEYKKQLSRKNDDLKISKELRKHILPEFLQCDISTSDLIEYIRKFMPYIKPEDIEIFTNFQHKICPLNIKVEGNCDAKLLNDMLDRVSISNITILIDDMSTLPLGMITNISRKTNVDSIYVPENEQNSEYKKDRYVYSLKSYLELRSKIDEILENVDRDSPEINRFLDIYRKLGESISYSWNEVTDEPSERDEAHNLIGPLLENECVCEGYALALKQALKCSGLEAQYIVGNVDRDEMDLRKKNTLHAWNQVKIDGKWYNCDLTWDAGRIKAKRELDYCLQSDEEFINHDTNCEGRVTCLESYSRKTINDILKPTMSRNEENEQFEEFLRELDQIDVRENKTSLTSVQNLGRETIDEQSNTQGKNDVEQKIMNHVKELENEHGNAENESLRK